MATKHDTIVILSTAPPDKAAGIAEALVRERLVACVNTLPVRSCYWWKDEICKDEEHLLVMKTTLKKADEVISAVKRMHGYEVPEVLVLPVIAGFAPYLEWVAQETSNH
jgi:periplasmic divalent cation tolerance protein